MYPPSLLPQRPSWGGSRRRLLIGSSLLALPLFGSRLACAAAASDASADASDRQAAARYLESIQRATYRSLGTEPRIYSEEFIQSSIQRFLDSATAVNMSEEQRSRFAASMKKELLASTPSRYEDPLGYALISSLDSKIRKVIDSSLHMSTPPVFGTLPTRHVNARAFRVPGARTKVVVFEDQIWNFANLFCKAIAMGVPSKGRGEAGESFSTDLADLPAWLKSHPDPAQRMYELLSAYVTRGAPGAAPQYFPPQPHAVLADKLRESMEVFVLGHEYGHVIAGHLGEGKTVRAAIGDAHFDEEISSWQQELEADGLGLALSVRAMRNEGLDVALSYWGADLFMTALDAVERALGVMRDGREPSANELAQRASSHPPPALRRESLRQVAIKYYGDAGKAAVKLGEFAQQLMEALWSEVRPRLEKLYGEGVRPHRVWLPAQARASGPSPTSSAASASASAVR